MARADYRGRGPAAHGGMARRAPPTGSNPTRRPINVGRLLNELNNAMPADDASWSPMAASPAHWGGLLFDTKRAGRALHRRSRLRLHRLWRCPARWAPQLAAPGRGRGRAHRRRRLQHDDRRTRDRAPRRTPTSRSDRLQQRRVGLREGAAARRCTAATTNPPISSRSTMPRSPDAFGCHGIRVERPGALRRRASSGVEERDTADRHRRRGHARPGADAARPSTTAPSRSRRATGPCKEEWR